ncbi:Werner Syndrome-like exonuclease [Senna tora]|uniref:3'-5' exonuclease n=1 Tax=Senna tora TaxID=362788 RepID=A0A835CB90_9FABA|nr:Werner Syndrome-like exonuclease [Senna tora]
MENQERFSRLASFICDFDDDEPFSDQDLRAIDAIEAQFQSSLRNKRNERMRLPEMKFGGHISYCKTATGADKISLELLKIVQQNKREMVQTVLGFDIEWRPSFTTSVPNGKAAVVQIYAGTGRCYVLQIIHSGIPQNLQLMLEDPEILKVGVNIANDARKLFNDYKVSVKGLEDLSFLANQKLGGNVRYRSLAHLTEKLLSKELPKPSRIRMGNWESNPLSDEQIEYAAIDAYASWYLFKVLKDLPNIAREAVVEE